MDRDRMLFDDAYYIELAKKAAALFSGDATTKVGAVIVNEVGRLVTYGYNDLPPRIEKWPSRYERPMKYKYIVHAEQAAIYNAAANGQMVGGCTMYVHGLPPCTECAKGIIQSGIVRLVRPRIDLQPHQEHWRDDLDRASAILLEAKVAVHTY